MKKRFNITGTCNAKDHYTMDDSRRFAAIMDMVEYGEYFVINRPRQYGKTTMLFALMRELDKREDYLPIKMDFQGIDSKWLESDTAFAQMVLMHIKKDLKRRYADLVYLTENALTDSLDAFSEWISDFIVAIGKKVVLLIDEVDASSNYEPFLRFLGMLRNKFLAKEEGEITFHSVVLAGVHDIKSLKFKLRRPEVTQYNSPWNVAADFKVVI